MFRILVAAIACMLMPAGAQAAQMLRFDLFFSNLPITYDPLTNQAQSSAKVLSFSANFAYPSDGSIGGLGDYTYSAFTNTSFFYSEITPATPETLYTIGSVQFGAVDFSPSSFDIMVPVTSPSAVALVASQPIYNYTGGFNSSVLLRIRGTDAVSAEFATAQLAPGVPEPTIWAMLILGFALVGSALRNDRVQSPVIAGRASCEPPALRA